MKKGGDKRGLIPGQHRDNVSYPQYSIIFYVYPLKGSPLATLIIELSMPNDLTGLPVASCTILHA
jgi:hypothetical protein